MPLLRRPARPRGAHLPPRERLPALTERLAPQPCEIETHLAEGELTMLGAHPEASNLAIVCEVEHEGSTLTAIYKPVQGERPLWDYPDGHLAHRERAAYLVARLGGFDCVPATVLRAGPLGEGSVQRWVGTLDEPADSPVAVTRPGQIPPGYLRVLSGEDERGTGVVLSHPDDPVLRSLSVLDAVINNSDRKGSHVLLEGDGVYGIDNGVSLSVEPKLRTVLWGWAGDPLTDADRARVERLVEAIAGSPEAGELDELLTVTEVDALVARCERLLRAGRHPRPGHGWPSVPWPPV